MRRGILPSQRWADNRKCSQSGWKGRQGNPARSLAALFSDFSCSNSWLFWRLPQTQGPIFSAGLSFLMCCCCQKKKKKKNHWQLQKKSWCKGPVYDADGTCLPNKRDWNVTVDQPLIKWKSLEFVPSMWSCPHLATCSACACFVLPAEEGLPNCREVSEESQAQVVAHILRVTNQPRVFRSV